jgi:hypothetical protein
MLAARTNSESQTGMATAFDDLPIDPESAFLVLEAEFHQEYQEEVERADNNSWADEARLKYAGKVRAAIEELNIDFNFFMPDFSDIRADYDRFQTFRREIEALVTKIRIRKSRANTQNSVKLNSNTKTKLRQLLERIKETILLLDESDDKREALLRRAAALEDEINRDRTRFDAMAALWIALCDKTGAGFEKLEPARKWIDSLANLVAQAKSFEGDVPSLPRSQPPKQIEPPKQFSNSQPADDEIPF